MRVAILHNEPGPSTADQDVLEQVASVRAALTSAGHTCTTVPCTLDLAATARRLHEQRVDLVFNLVESLGGTDRLAAAAALLLEALALPFTGCSAMAMQLTGDKVAAKRLFGAIGVPTPAFFSANDEQLDPGRYIVKPRHEHASIGMFDDAVTNIADAQTLRALLQERRRLGQCEMFAERYIDGREFNLAVLDGEVLAPAEIDFSAFPPEKPRIVGYKAKWDADSFEYQQTPRNFDFDTPDRSLLSTLQDIALRLWQAVPLRGYARVDFRVDHEGGCHVLEINTNPCLSPDAGFAAAAAASGYSYQQMVCRLLDAALVHA